MTNPHPSAAAVAARAFAYQLDARTVERIDDLHQTSTIPRTSPSLASILWMVGTETPAISAKVFWSIPRSARAARNWFAVITMESVLIGEKSYNLPYH